MQKLYLTLLAASFLLGCKTSLNVADFKAENQTNYQNISTIDSSLVRFIEPYREQVDREMREVIAETEFDLIKRKPESLLTNYLADVLLEEGQLYAAKLQQKPIPQAAYQNYGGIRADIPKGKITVGKIFEVMPFENEMVLLKVKGSDLWALGETVARRGGDSLAGMRLRISNGQLLEMEIDQMPLNKQGEYWLVTNDYVANGGDDMTMLQNRVVRINTGIKLRDCFIEHLRNNFDAGKVISPKLDGRISNE